MNIVYAVKIFGALVIVLMAMRLVVGKALRSVMNEADFKASFSVVIGTLVVSCFSWKEQLFFAVYAVWSILAPRFFGKSGESRVLAYVMLACISPQFVKELENIGPLRDVLTLYPPRVAAIFLLLPEMLRLFARRDKPKAPWWLTLCDVSMVIYFVYWVMHLYGYGPLSTLLRQAVGLWLDTLLPYYVLSRTCVESTTRQRVLAVILFAAAYQAFVGLAEALSRHLLYSQLQYLYQIRWNILGAMTRGSFLRAQAAFPGPLPLAIMLLFGLGIWAALKPTVTSRNYKVLGLVLVGGIIGTFSRGPLLAAMILGAGLFSLRFLSGRKFVVLSIVLAVVGAAGWKYGLGDAVVALASSTSAADQTADFNVRYREQLLEMSVALIKQSPWFGVPNYLQALEPLRQGEGIIDLVNTYLVVTLNVGLCGLVLMLLPFGITLWRDASSVGVREKGAREAVAWMPLTVAVLVVIFTVSPISIVQSIIIWVVALPLARQQEQHGVRASARARYAVPPFGSPDFADAKR